MSSVSARKPMPRFRNPLTMSIRWEDSAEAVQLPDHQDIVRPQKLHTGFERRAVGASSRFPVLMDMAFIDAGCQQGVTLQRRTLPVAIELLTEGVPLAGIKKVAFGLHYVGDKRWVT
jgi:hypothetical protein